MRRPKTQQRPGHPTYTLDLHPVAEFCPQPENYAPVAELHFVKSVGPFAPPRQQPPASWTPHPPCDHHLLLPLVLQLHPPQYQQRAPVHHHHHHHQLLQELQHLGGLEEKHPHEDCRHQHGFSLERGLLWRGKISMFYFFCATCDASEQACFTSSGLCGNTPNMENYVGAYVQDMKKRSDICS